MKKSTVFLYCLVFCQAMLVAQREDYNWILGYPDDPTSPAPPYFGGIILNFQNGRPDTIRFATEAGTNVTSSVSDAQGNLLFYSNGCEIYDRNHQIIPNGDHLNPGDSYDYSCKNILKSYGGLQGLIILPWPKRPHLYRILHLRYIKNAFDANELLTTIVDMSLNGGHGAATEKNQVLTPPDTLVLISAVRHANGTDWWVVIPKAASDKYYVFLLDSVGIHGPQVQEFEGFPFSGGACQASFSPDGTLYAEGGSNGVNIFRFDRCTGTLCSPRKIPFDSTYAYEIFGGGLAFSPNSRYLYRGTVLRLYQYDLTAADISDSRILIDTADNFVDPVGPIHRTFFNLGLAPDNKIYLPDGNSSRYWNTIHQPNERGTACMFRQHDLLLPAFHNFAVPNFPNYRLGPLAYTCENYQGGCAVNDTVPTGGVMIYPNPATDMIRVTGSFIPSSAPVIQIFDVLGRLVLEHRLEALPEEISIAGLPAAGYFYRIVTTDRHRINSGLLIKVR